MSLYSVIREAGPGFLDGGAAAQPDVADHASFMDGLADAGLVLLAGLLARTETGRLRALLIVSAAGEDEIRQLLDDDPWVRIHRQRLNGRACRGRAFTRCVTRVQHC